MASSKPIGTLGSVAAEYGTVGEITIRIEKANVKYTTQIDKTDVTYKTKAQHTKYREQYN